MGGPPTGAGGLVGQQLGKYELLALLALGGTAEIYLARIDGTAGFEKYVVVKCLHDHLAEDPEFVSMFLDEARLGAQLDHSNIVQTLGLGEHEGRYYLVMEFIAGLSLALVGRRASERVRGGKVPVPITLNVAAQACSGLHYAHERVSGLVHRDISPQNLVVTYEGLVKVVDFGIAKAEYRETKTRTGTVKGKFAYMSPEQCQAGQVDRRTDVFACGVIIWELLTGRRLFKRESTYETYQAVVACDVPPPSAVNHELDPAIDGLVMKALERDRDARYPTAEAFGEAMMGYLHHRGKPSGPGEIARFFEECFQQEVDEHGARMRELIEGRRKSVAEQKLLQWDASELDGSASVMEIDELSGVMEESESRPRVSAAEMQAGGNRGPVSPPMARHPALEAAAPLPDENFESTTDVENEAQGDATRIEANPMDSAVAMAAARRASTTDERKKPQPPVRKQGVQITPPGLRAGGAPLDPFPHERDALLAAATPKPSQVPPPRAESPAPLPAPPIAPRFVEAPTVLGPETGTGSGRFADVPTVHAVGTPAGMPGTGQTQMLETGDLLDVTTAPTNPLLPQADPPSYPMHPSMPQAAEAVWLPDAEPRRIEPWVLGVIFVIVLALVTGITVAIARAVS
jgi:serine/threonine-protein kinase